MDSWWTAAAIIATATVIGVGGSIAYVTRIHAKYGGQPRSAWRRLRCAECVAAHRQHGGEKGGE